MKNALRVLTLPLAMGAAMYTYADQNNIEILSATIKDQSVQDAKIVIQRNGEQSISSVSDSMGKASLLTPYADSNESLILIKKEGYSTLVAKCPCNGMSYALSPTMKGLDSMRVVLSWGKTPADLDSHMVYTGNHIYFEKKTGVNGNLDVDDTNGFGPETITLTKRDNDSAYVYAVHDYSDRSNPNTLNLTASQAKVFVYVGESLVRTYYIPKGKEGNLWTVFKVNKNGDIKDINNITGISIGEGNVANVLNPLLGDNVNIVTQAWGSGVINESNRLNLSGEKSYQNKNYDEAINFFTDAVNHYPDNSKAYGNLGLVYQKTGRTAEAIWANRKAIALASGPNAQTIKAGANYNIARIYEANNQYSEALNYYKAAKAQKANSVYDNAISRVLQKLN